MVKSVGNDFWQLVFRWQQENKRVLLNRECEKLLLKGITLCKVIVPEVKEINNDVYTKNDLLNKFIGDLGTQVNRVSKNEELRKRQEDFWDKDEFSARESGIVGEFKDYEWNVVWYQGMKGEKLENIYEKKRIWLIGPCMVNTDTYLMVKNSLPAQLQNLVKGYGYEVIRVFYPNENLDFVYDIENIPIRKKDIVMIIHSRRVLRDENCGFIVDLKEVYNKPREVTWFKDHSPLHVNGVANKANAEEIVNRCLQSGIIREETNDNLYLQKGEILSKDLQQEVFLYIDNIIGSRRMNERSQEKCAKVGAIVMNCNPFTKGHLFLIEKAAMVVDLLYIFVVEEDKSFFAFENRFALVKAGVAHLNNVVVVPSGEYVLSYKTFQPYFGKEKMNTAKVDATNDIEIFARYIAPRLNITKRFVGEEPFDMVTKQYNEQMAEILPQFGVEFVEIPRRVTEIDGQVISASRVRLLMKEERWEEIYPLVPETTYEYIMQEYVSR